MLTRLFHFKVAAMPTMTLLKTIAKMMTKLETSRTSNANPLP
jgi:hypothetical protein